MKRLSALLNKSKELLKQPQKPVVEEALPPKGSPDTGKKFVEEEDEEEEEEIIKPVVEEQQPTQYVRERSREKSREKSDERKAKKSVSFSQSRLEFDLEDPDRYVEVEDPAVTQDLSRNSGSVDSTPPSSPTRGVLKNSTQKTDSKVNDPLISTSKNGEKGSKIESKGSPKEIIDDPIIIVDTISEKSSRFSSQTIGEDPLIIVDTISEIDSKTPQKMVDDPIIIVDDNVSSHKAISDPIILVDNITEKGSKVPNPPRRDSKSDSKIPTRPNNLPSNAADYDLGMPANGTSEKKELSEKNRKQDEEIPKIISIEEDKTYRDNDSYWINFFQERRRKSQTLTQEEVLASKRHAESLLHTSKTADNSGNKVVQTNEPMVKDSASLGIKENMNLTKNGTNLKQQVKDSSLKTKICDTLCSTTDGNELSVISLNLLADYNLSNSIKNPDDGRYKHAVDVASWEVRLSGIKALFQKYSQIDVFVFQEVDFSRFTQDLKPFLETLGFTGIHQWDEDFKKKKEVPHPFGVATFYQKHKFRESFRESRSRSLIVGLSKSSENEIEPAPSEKNEPAGAKKNDKKKDNKKKANSDWFIVNVHLEADPNKNDKRLAQLSSTLFNLSVHAKVNPRTARIVVLGDFNSLKEEPPFQWLLTSTAPSGEEFQEGDTTKQDESEKLTHAFKFQDAYFGTGSVAEASTYADPFADGRVDHVLYTNDTCTIQSVLSVPELTEATKKYGIFNKDYPSDHYPVGCTVRTSFSTVQEPEQIDEEIDPNVCPLTDGQMRVLEFLEKGAPKRSGKGKPTPSELAAMKAHTDRINAFCTHLTKPQKAWVAKWRKKFKAPKEDEIIPRLTRSQSLTMKPLIMTDFGLGDLFNEDTVASKKVFPSKSIVQEVKRLDDKPLLLKAKSEMETNKTRRRQTITGVTTPKTSFE